MYIAGDNGSSGYFQWRIEKRTLFDGSLVVGFGTGGGVTENPSTTSYDSIGTIAIDLQYMYVGGWIGGNQCG